MAKYEAVEVFEKYIHKIDKFVDILNFNKLLFYSFSIQIRNHNMKKYFLFGIVPGLILSACSSINPVSESRLKNEVIPLPVEIHAFDNYLKINDRAEIVGKNKDEILAATTLKSILSTYGISANIVANPTDESNIFFTSNAKIDSLGNEGYKLTVNQQGVSIVANKGAGLFYAVQTIRQLIEKDNKIVKIQYCNIYDKPLYKWRGLHLDVSRHFFDIKFIKKYIDNMSKYKLNTFHWHLTDDQGWRIEIKKYPKLVTIGSKRSETVIEKNFNPFIGDGVPYEGFYTQEQIKEVVKFAEQRYVTIVPEIEMPGHSQAALAAYPEYSCTGESCKVLTKWGITDNIYCPYEKTFTFLQNILDEVMELFPSEYIHIGGDEVPKTQWKKSDFCQELIKKENLKDENGLQSYFIGRIEQYLNSKGRYIVGWDEILEGGLAPNATVMSWRGEKGGIAAANAGHNVVMTPGFAMYFDHYQANPKYEPFAIGGFTPLKTVYDYNPMPKEISIDKQKYVIGVQANVWTEYMKSSQQVEYMVYPRLLALSEIAWVKPGQKDWNGFQKRLPNNFMLLEKYGINFRLPEPEIKYTIINENEFSLNIYSSVPNAKIYYSSDGSKPGNNSKLFKSELKMSLPDSIIAIKAIIQLPDGRQSNYTEQKVEKPL
ncbi:MAG: family 20 glycosylhydrolase [Chlorobi bacterium]|nr:family 20 glycosylhydrolase [Chlorobiota bacterium]